MSSNPQYAVDIVLCVDVTGSMAPVIDTVREGALSFHEQLGDAMARKNTSIARLRIRVIAFRDFADKADNAIEQTGFLTIPEQSETFERFVRGLRAEDGGDAPESGLEALAMAVRSPWERGLEERRHVVVMFTDAPAHPLGTGRKASTYPAGIASSMEELAAQWGATSGQDAVMEYAAKRMLIFAPDEEPWNRIADEWNNVGFFPSQAGTGLEEWEMAEVINFIAGGL
ncbi:vWA domain-containing protein [Nonomuraea soli]|uniref:VWFA domain-containing protein n=1 Tax=Nonomuraea soli TaxID=1032476 RepID=A0A7W0HS17_9ACTN|nr:vWA domain-containing protein [Nonomuraea soli]MBA2893422.1 hypothetical protein [Nonomuraea soli]